MAFTLAVALFLIVLGGKLVILDRFGSDIPNWDQWDGEGQALLLPYLQDRLQWTDFFTAHNEHRMAPSKLIMLGLLIANGQWDSRLQNVVNALLHAALAVAIFGFGRPLLPPRWIPVWFVGVAAFIATPVAWQNVLGGFHSAQVLILAISALAFVLLFRFPAGRAGWWLGLGCAATAMVTQGSGLLTPAVAAAVLAGSAPPTAALRRHGVTITACILLFALGWWLRVEAPHHEALKATTVGEFFWTIWRSLQWPVRGLVGFPLLAWLPWTWLSWQVLVRRRWNDPALLVIVAAGGWTLLHYVAAGYVRGAGGAWPASRYLDTVAFGIIVNLLALFVIFSRVPLAGWRRWTRAGTSLATLGLLAHGLARELDSTITHDLPGVVSAMRAREFNTRAYLITGERARLDGVEIPFPNPDILADHLKHPEIRAILPVSIRLPLALHGEADPADSFTFGGVPSLLSLLAPEAHWGSFSMAGNGQPGVWRSGLLPHAGRGYWQVRVAGTLDRPGVELDLVTADDGVLATLTRHPDSSSDWTTLVFPAPNEPARLRARDTGSEEWIAFTAPTFMATGSYRAWQLVRHGEAVLLAGLFAAATAMIISMAAQRPPDRRIGPLGKGLPTRVAMLAALTLSSTLATLPVVWVANRQHSTARLELMVTNSRETTFQVFFRDEQSGFQLSHSAASPLGPSDAAQPYRQSLPGGTITHIRLDPAHGDHVVELASMRIVDGAGRALRRFTTDDIIFTHQVAKVETTAHGMRIMPESGSNDPFVELRLAAPLRTAYMGWALVRRMLAAAGMVLIIGTLVTLAVVYWTSRCQKTQRGGPE